MATSAGHTIRKVSIVIPAYNEAPTLGDAIARVLAIDLGVEKEVLVVDNNSTDDTHAIASAFPNVIVLKESVQGKGAAVRTGFQAATGDVLLIQDADLEYDATDFPSLLAPIRAGTADLVLGFRGTAHQAGRGLLYKLGNGTITVVANLLYGVSAEEHTGGYKVFVRELVTPILIRSNDFAYEHELVCKLLKRKYRLVTVPIRYVPRTRADGKKIDWRDGFKILWAVIKYRFID